MRERSRCIIALGNELREDDGVGLAVARRLQRMIPVSQAAVLVLEDQLFEIPQLIKAYDQVAILDALPPETAPGSVHALRYPTESGPGGPVYSLHDLDLFWQLAEAYRSGLRGPVLLVGIEAGSLAYRIGFSPSLQSSLPLILGKVMTALELFWGMYYTDSFPT